MKSSLQMQDAISWGVNPASPCVKPSRPPQQVFSPAVRFAPKELSPFQVIRIVGYWAAIIVTVVAMARSGFSHLSQVWSERPGHHSVK
jgi:hypothetical protein